MEDHIIKSEEREIRNSAGTHKCIFCGSNLTILESEWTDLDWDMRPTNKDTTVQVTCTNCGMCGPFGDTEEEAIGLYYKQSHDIPKMYTPDDIANCVHLLCWLEERIVDSGYKWVQPALLSASDEYIKNAFTDLPLWHGTYGKTWRCWDAKPSDVCSAQTRWDE